MKISQIINNDDHFEDPETAKLSEVFSRKSRLLILMESDDEKKQQAISKLQDDIQRKSQIHRSRFLRYKYIDNANTLITTILSMSSITALASHFAMVGNEAAVFVSTICVSVSFVMSMCATFYKLSDKVADELLLTRQYKDLKQEMDIRILKNKLTGEQMMNFIEEIDSRLQLIEDNETIV